MKNKNFKGFTLVELVIVIVILAILSTVSFVGFSSYTKSARDTNRLTSLKSIETGLKVYYSQSSKYPDPDNYVTIQASGTTIGYQGIIGDSVSKLIKSSSTAKDPYDFNNYVYYLNADKNKFELLGYMELSDKVNISYLGVNKTYAIDLSQRSLKILGSPLGIILDSQKNVLTGSVFEIKTSTSNYISYFGDNDFIIGSGSQFYSNIYNRRSDLLKNKNIANLDDSLVAYYDMETLSGTNLKDLSKNNINLAGTGGVVVGGAQGVLGNSTQFNGNNDFYGTTTLLNLQSPFSYSLWVKSNDTVSNPARILRQYDNGGVNLYFHAGNISFSTFNSSGSSNFDTLGFVGDDKWHLINYVFNNNQIKIFKDGTYITGSTLTGTYMVSGYNGFRIGSHRGGSEFYKGQLDEFRIYNRALSDSEIKNLYNSAFSN